MASTKQPSNEELLSLLNESEELPQLGKIDPVAEFIEYYNLKPGNDKILVKYLFILFKNFRKTPYKINKFKEKISIHYSIQNEFLLINEKESKLNDLLHTFDTSYDLDNKQYALVANFVEDCDLSEGKDIKIDSEVLYELMKLHYKKTNQRVRLKFEEFDDMISQLLTPIVTVNGNTYKLGNGLLSHFTLQEIEDAKNGKKENQTLQRKISKPKT